MTALSSHEHVTLVYVTVYGLELLDDGYHFV